MPSKTNLKIIICLLLPLLMASCNQNSLATTDKTNTKVLRGDTYNMDITSILNSWTTSTIDINITGFTQLTKGAREFDFKQQTNTTLLLPFIENGNNQGDIHVTANFNLKEGSFWGEKYHSGYYKFIIDYKINGLGHILVEVKQPESKHNATSAVARVNITISEIKVGEKNTTVAFKVNIQSSSTTSTIGTSASIEGKGVGVSNVSEGITTAPSVGNNYTFILKLEKQSTSSQEEIITISETLKKRGVYAYLYESNDNITKWWSSLTETQKNEIRSQKIGVVITTYNFAEKMYKNKTADKIGEELKNSMDRFIGMLDDVSQGKVIRRIEAECKEDPKRYATIHLTNL